MAGVSSTTNIVWLRVIYWTKGWRDHYTSFRNMLTCVLRLQPALYPWLWHFSLSVTLAWSTPPLLSLLTPHRSRVEFTFFTNPLSSATKTLSSPDQNRPVDTSSQVPEHGLSSLALLIGSLRGKLCCVKRRWLEEKSYLEKSSGCCCPAATVTSTASLGRDKQGRNGGSKVREDA